MAEPQRQPAPPSGSTLLGTALLGALAGAGGLAWWLWRHRQRQGRGGSPRLQGSLTPLEGGRESAFQPEGLPDRVQQLNQAIDDVRRQLEALQSKP
ncbi:MAG: hypothetical protein VKP70_11940 [Cyanobacteriota bacterium]|nr:hypothetical protein [Cyanobacteriota bacterium]